MNIQQLRYFEGICRYGSFSKAAQNLYISPQGLNMSILRLEEEFSCKLFIRSSNGVSVTEEGKFLLQRAQKILAEVDECERYFNDHQAGHRTVNLGCVYGALSEFAARTILDFEGEYPQIKVMAKEFPSVMCDNAVENGDVELALNVGPVDEKKFEGLPLFSSRLALLVQKSHPLAKEKSITPDNLSLLNGLRMVTVDENFKSPRKFLDFCKRERVEPEVKMLVGEIINVHRLVSTNEELAGLTVRSVSNAIPAPNMVCIPLKCAGLAWDVHLIKKRDVALMPSAQAFAYYIRNKMEIGLPFGGDAFQL